MRSYETITLKRFCVSAITIALALPICAQISTLNKKVTTAERPVVFKYDSLTNIEFYNKNNGPDTNYNLYYSEGKRSEENLRHLIGQRLYFYGDTAEMAKTSWLKFYKLNNGKNKKKNPYIYYPYTDFLNKYFTLAGFNVNNYGSNIFKLIPENENDTLYCRMENFIRHDFWTVEGYYEKAKKDYLHKKFVLKERFRVSYEENWLHRLSDDQCGKDLPQNSVWECTDVTLKGYKNRLSYSNVILVFTNNEYGDYYIYLDKYMQSSLKARRNRETLDLFEPKDQIDRLMADKLSKYNVKGKDFVYKNKYRHVYNLYKVSDGQKYEGEIPQNTEFHCTDVSFANNDTEKLVFIFHNDAFGDLYTFEYDFNRIFVTKDKYLQDKQNEEQRRKNILAKYGQVNGKTILEGKVRIGFTKAMCIEAWGEPDDINKSTGSWGVHEQWCYSDGSYLYFENGKLTSIDN